MIKRILSIIAAISINTTPFYRYLDSHNRLILRLQSLAHRQLISQYRGLLFCAPTVSSELITAVYFIMSFDLIWICRFLLSACISNPPYFASSNHSCSNTCDQSRQAQEHDVLSHSQQVHPRQSPS